MIENAVTEHRGLTEVVFTAADLISGSSESNGAKVFETLLNILEGQVRNSNTRKAYKAAWRSFFFAFFSEYKLENVPMYAAWNGHSGALLPFLVCSL